MTPQVQKSNAALSLADRVRGRKSTGGVGRARWLVTNTDVAAIPNADQNTPRSENVEPEQRKVSASEKQVRPNLIFAATSSFFSDNLIWFIHRLSRNEGVLLCSNQTCSLERIFPVHDATR
jgi:hypothetical protein